MKLPRDGSLLQEAQNVSSEIRPWMALRSVAGTHASFTSGASAL